MPVSRGRKKKQRNGPPVRVARTSPPMPPRGSGSYVPDAFRDNTGALATILQGAPGEALPVMFLPMLWSTMAQGVPGNVCVSACMTVAEAYAQFGIAAHPIPVSVAIEPAGGGPVTSYGTERPHWTDDATFVGHVVLDLPQSGRFADVTIEQFPGLRRLKMGPLISRAPAGSRGASLRAGSAYRFTVPRGDLQGPQGPGPALTERLRGSPHRRLVALLDALADGDPYVDEDDDWRLPVPDGGGGTEYRRLDEIRLPAGFPPP